MPKKMSRKKESRKKTLRVLVELRMKRGVAATRVLRMAGGIKASSFILDTSYKPVPVAPSRKKGLGVKDMEEVVIVRGEIDEDRIKDLEARPEVIKVWRDAPVQPFLVRPGTTRTPAAKATPCPVKPCDCSSGDPPEGDFGTVARYLGVDKIWAQGIKGGGIVIGIVDGGITAKGRRTSKADTGHTSPDDECDEVWPKALVPGVVDGYPAKDWGTTGVAWCWHGNMTASDARAMAPEARIYDIRISDASTFQGSLSDVIQAYQWAIDRHRKDGTPHVLSNSWGMYQKVWAADYCTDPDHPTTRKIVEAVDEGILVLFAAGNCGKVCPSYGCGSDTGPGKSIWGANGHPRVMTVGAVNQKGEWVGYSSQGPAALDKKKPDFCSITHFKGYFPSDTGTSAATPVAAGVVALLKEKKPSLTQDEVKAVLMKTAKNIGSKGWDKHSGAGIIQAKAAFDLL